MPRPLSDEESDHRDEIVARETVASTGSVLLSTLILIASSIPSWPIQLQRRRTSGFKFSLSTTTSRIGYLASSGLLVHPFRLGQKCRDYVQIKSAICNFSLR